jgi:hypothetical protein
MSTSQKSTVLFDFQSLAVTERKRTSSRGENTRVTLDFRSQPIIAHHDPVIFRPVAEAMANVLRKQIQEVQADADPNTKIFRIRAAKALKEGKPWAVRRYAGGKTGAKEPGSVSGDRLFNDSGRFAEGIVISATSDGNYTVNVTKNRLDPSTFRPGQFEAFIQQLRAHVPGVKDPASMASEPEVHDAYEEVGKRVMEVAGSSAAAQLKAALKDLGTNVQELGGAVEEFGPEGG